jgi:hypothetical protein
MEDEAKRSPNGLVWGETLDDFFRIARHPKQPSVAMIYSRSMAQALGENREGKNDWRDNEGEPQLVAPWPVLMLRGYEEGKLSPVGDHARIKVDLDAPADAPPEPSDPASVKSSAFVVEIPNLSELPQTQTNTTPEDINTHPGVSQEVNADESCNGTATASKDARYEENKVHHNPTVFSSIPKLEEFIPEHYFPDVLLAHDEHYLVAGLHTDFPSSANATATPIRYKRVFPVVPRAPTNDTPEEAPSTPEPAAEKVAHLELTPDALLGSGHHSYVYRAALTLPPPLTARSRTGQVHVAAKLAMPHAEARRLLANEARVYARMPRHLQETWSGFNIICEELEHPFPLGPVAPKFYGWYEPEDVPEEQGKKESEPEREGEADSVSEEEGDEEPVPKVVRRPKPSGILLLEECGEPIEPDTFTFNDRCVLNAIRLPAQNPHTSPLGSNATLCSLDCTQSTSSSPLPTRATSWSSRARCPHRLMSGPSRHPAFAFSITVVRKRLKTVRGPRKTTARKTQQTRVQARQNVQN